MVVSPPMHHRRPWHGRGNLIQHLKPRPSASQLLVSLSDHSEGFNAPLLVTEIREAFIIGCSLPAPPPHQLSWQICHVLWFAETRASHP